MTTKHTTDENSARIALADEELLASLGYKQEFKRAFTPFEVFGIAFSIIALLPSLVTRILLVLSGNLILRQYSIIFGLCDTLWRSCKHGVGMVGSIYFHYVCWVGTSRARERCPYIWGPLLLDLDLFTPKVQESPLMACRL